MVNCRRQTALLGLLLLAPACASLQERLTAAENRTAALEAQVADLQASQENIVSRLTQIRQDLQAALDPLRSQQADRGEDLRAMEAEISSLRQQLAMVNERLARLSDEIATRPSAQTPGGAPMPPPQTTGGARAANPDTAQPSGVSPTGDVFDTAYLDYLRANYVLAIDGFQEYVQRYPSSDRADDALYWIGECLAAQDNHGEARARFLDILSRYPSGDRVPDAMLRAALESIELGRPSEANTELRQLIATHPNSDAALIACMQLQRLGQEAPRGCPSPPAPPPMP